MSRFFITLIIFSFIFFVIEFYAFQALKTITKNKVVKVLWILIALGVYLNLFYTLYTTPRSAGQTKGFQLAAGFLLTFLIPKLVIVTIMFGEDIVRSFQKVISFISSGPTEPIPDRRLFISKLALGLAAIPFASFLYGIFQGRYNYKVLKHQLVFEDLPDAFDGFTITQISDIHSGSFTNPDKIQYGIDLINDQESDVILFTGDIVNNKAEEMNDWIGAFKNFKAPYGKYSILGNHDYGDYVQWSNQEEKAKKFQDVKDVHPKIGFDLLLNENRYIEKDGQRIALVGVENWGKGFNQAGDLKKASEGLQKEDFKILMSHSI